jgi:hypothetical protein
MSKTLTDPDDPSLPQSDGGQVGKSDDRNDHTSPEFRDLPPLTDGESEVRPLAKYPGGAPEEPDADASEENGD